MSHETMLDINNIVAAITECNSYIVKTDFLFSNRDIDAEYKSKVDKNTTHDIFVYNQEHIGLTNKQSLEMIHIDIIKMFSFPSTS